MVSFLFLFQSLSGLKNVCAADKPAAEFPAMNKGDSYEYLLGGKRVFAKVVRVNDDGTFVMVIKGGKRRKGKKLYFDRNFLITDKDGNIRSHKIRVFKHLRMEFPLYQGKSWIQNFSGMGGKGPVNITARYRVDKYKKIRIKAGVLDAFRISVDLHIHEYPEKSKFGYIWYAPEAKMIVKSSYTYSDDVELARYDVSQDDMMLSQRSVDKKASGTETKKVKPEESHPEKKTESKKAVVYKEADIMKNIPGASVQNRDAIAVVIGNSEYMKTGTVNYAINDAEAIRKYLIRTLGYKDGNIFFLKNALKSDFEIHFGVKGNHQGKLFNAVKEGKSDVFIYYSGHGAPGLKDRKGYFVPVEADPQYVEFGGYSLDVFYENISKLSARSLTIVLDSCFSGATIFKNISPIVLEVSNPVVSLKNGVVITSSKGAQVSSWYNEKEHGMFTYFFLKAIHDKNADFDKDNKLTYNEIYKYVSDKTEGVPYYARRLHNVDQVPTIEGQNVNKVFIQY
jgi:hypothetical protein